MRIFIADIPKPLLFDRTVLLQGEENFCVELQDILRYAGIPILPQPNQSRWTLRGFLSLEEDHPRSMETIEQALSELAGDHRQKMKKMQFYTPGTLSFRKPIDPDSKVIIGGQRLPLSRMRRGTGMERMTGFIKFSSALADPGEKVCLPGPDRTFDVDAVLGVVIGKRAERVPVEGSLSYVAGFTLLADMTDRKTFEVECSTNNNLLAKNHHNLSVFGPCIRTFTDPQVFPAIAVTLRVNGHVRQRFTVNDLAWGVEEMISSWSRLVLEPGDVLGLGATLAEAKDGEVFESPVSIKRGDLLEVESPSIGLLRAEMV